MRKTLSRRYLFSKLLAMPRLTKILFVVQSTYLLLAALFFGRTVNIVHPDAIEYASIARHYSEGNFVEAINGIWSPLMSWVLAVADVIDIDKFLFYKLFLIVVGGFIIWSANKVLRQYLGVCDPLVYTVAMITIGSFALYGACFFYPTPDLITALFAILLMWSLLSYRERPTLLHAAMIGLVVGGGYYTKNYFFYFGIAIAIMYLPLLVWENRKLNRIWQSTRDLSLVLLVAGLLFGVWVAAMSYKYGAFTTNPIGSYTISQVGPSYPGAPVVSLGLLDPPYESSYTAREDPSAFEYVAWSPLDSILDLRYYLFNVIPNNILKASSVMLPTLIAATLAIAAVIVTRSRSPSFRWRELGQDTTATLLVISPFIYISGYLLVHVEGGFRYLWPAHVLLILLCAYLLTKLPASLLRSITMILVGGYISLAPFFATHRLTTQASERADRIEQLANDIEARAKIPTGSRVATNDPYTAASICYELDLRCYGLPKQTLQERQLAEKRIQYIFNFSYKPSLNISGDIVFSNNAIQVVKLDS